MFPRVCVILCSVLRFTIQIPHIVLSIIRPFHFTCFSSIVLVVITTFIAPRVNAQSGTIYDGYTPTGVAPGSPTGSYALSDLEDINLFNGHLNLNFPLLRVGGRGAIEHTVLLNIQPIPWHIMPVFLPGNELDVASDISYDPIVKYGPGVLRVQGGVVGDTSSCVDNGHWISTLTRLVFYTPDGTQLQLHDQVYQGKAVSQHCSVFPGPNRGRVFVSADGGSMTFISDTDVIDSRSVVIGSKSGNLMMKDGTLYRIDDGYVSYIRDRNGNKISFTYSNGQVTAITDPLNRRVTISYADQSVRYDTITYHGFGGANRAIKVWYSPLQAVLRPDFAIKKYNQLFPPPDANWGGPYDGNEIFNPGRVSKVELPNQKAYEFYYNSYGELARLILPTGGGVDYDYVPAGYNGNNRSGLILSRRLSKRTSYTILTSTTNPSNPPPGTVEGKQFYGMTMVSRDPGVPDTVVTVEHKDAGNILLAQEKHYFYGIVTEESGGCLPTLYSPWYSGREFKTESYSVTNGALGGVLKRIEHTWYPNIPAIHYVCHGTINVDPAPNPRIIQTTATLLDTNQVTKQTFNHDQYNNVVEVDEYDYGNGAPGPVIRRTYTSYLTNNPWQNNVNYAADLNIHIRNLPTQISVFDDNNTELSRTSFYYDVYSQAPLQDCPNIVQHDAGFHTGYGPRGNLVKTTKVADFDEAANNIDNYFHYDIAGNVVKTIDGRGFPIDYEFTDRFGSPDDDAQENTPPTQLNGQRTYALATKVTNALGHKNYKQYDYFLGKLVNEEDANEVVSSIAYNDTLDRPTLVIQARYIVGSGVPAMRRQATFTYDDVSRVVTTTIDRATFNDNTPLTRKSYYDSLGRTSRSAAYEGSTWAITDKRFDALSRVSQVSSPYRAADPGSAVAPAGGWAKTGYDSLNRVVKVETPDGAQVITQYSGNQVTVTDQDGKSRRSKTDALGRLTEVTENPGGLSYLTEYEYDTLDNLRKVKQGPQVRNFAYDSVSRLISATNPESGPITYAYDPNGNLVEKTDAREVKTAMTYDALNRIKTQTYSGTTPEAELVANATPPVSYFYDDYASLPGGEPTWPTWSCGGQTLPNTPVKGRLIGVTYGTGSDGTYYRYDATGRIIGNLQRMGTPNFVTRYFYNLAGAVLEECRGYSNATRASVRNMSTYDDAGRLTDMRTSFNPHTTSKYLVEGISYTPFGALQTEKYGNGLIHSIGYNNRLQSTEIRLGTPVNPESVFTIYNLYGNAANPNVQDSEITLVQNNGNLARTKYVISGALKYSQTFQYDPLNRLKYAVEHNNGTYNDGARAWYQTFEYDFAGNRGINTASTSDNVDGANSALQRAEFSEVNNRITRAGYFYDAAGNLTEEPGKRYTYDAVNRLVTAEVVGGATSQYVYDGNGRRVKNTVSGVGTRFEYGAEGELIAERNDAGVVTNWYYYRNGELLATSVNGTTHKYAASDHLGSPRAWTDEVGNLTEGGRHDYLPFGVELPVGVGIRSASLGYGGDSVRQKFTGKERDAETGLDFFQARYFSSIQGRFTSPDEFKGGPVELFYFAEDASNNPTFYADLTNPQSLNKYQYTYNNPLRYTDPTGHCPRCVKSAVKTGIKSATKGKVDLGEVYDVAEAVATIVDPNASLLDKGLAIFDIASPVSSKELKAIDKFLDNTDFVKDAQKAIGKLHKNNNDAESDFILYQIDDIDGNPLKIGVADAQRTRTDGRPVRMADSLRKAQKEYPGATATQIKDLGRTTKGKAKEEEAAAVRQKRTEGSEMKLNREKDKRYRIE